MTLLDRLRERLDDVTDQLISLTGTIQIQRSRRGHDSNVVVIAPEYYWDRLSPEQLGIQHELKKAYAEIVEQFRILLWRAPFSLVQKFNECNECYSMWLELSSNWALSSDKAENESAIREARTRFDCFLEVFSNIGDAVLLVVPDTNALLASPDPTDYRKCIGQDSFIFALLPTVLGELESLRMRHPEERVRNNAKRMINRIKGWRHQGRLNNGVTVDRTILVKTFSHEPDMQRTLPWLDASIADDRIVASVLQICASSPGSRVVIVTGDINLQNKCDAASIETIELRNT